MILEYTTNKERVNFWKSRGFPEAQINKNGYIEVLRIWEKK